MAPDVCWLDEAPDVPVSEDPSVSSSGFVAPGNIMKVKECSTSRSASSRLKYWVAEDVVAKSLKGVSVAK